MSRAAGLTLHSEGKPHYLQRCLAFLLAARVSRDTSLDSTYVLETDSVLRQQLHAYVRAALTFNIAVCQNIGVPMWRLRRTTTTA